MTASHSAAVAVYAHDIAKELGLTEEMQKLALLCGLVHDIGKHNVVSDLIESPTRLTEAEYRIVKQHTEIGEAFIAYAAEIVRLHHEWVNGNGYPDGKDGSRLPMLAKVIAVADAYNAMTSRRPYKEPLSSDEAINRLTTGVDTQFDEAAVTAFLNILHRSSEGYRAGERESIEFVRIMEELADW